MRWAKGMQQQPVRRCFFGNGGGLNDRLCSFRRGCFNRCLNHWRFGGWGGNGCCGRCFGDRLSCRSWLGSGLGGHGRGRHLFGVLRCGGAQNDGALIHTCAHAAGDFFLRNTGKHLCVWGGRFGTKIPIIRGQITEVFRNRLHRAKRIVETFEGA
jgi:hypothetical protein